MNERNAYRKIYITINSNCNNNCINCLLPKDFKSSGDILSPSKLESILTKIPIQKYDIIEISGGEPTLHPSLIDILYILKSRSHGKIVLLTNAENLVDYKFAKTICEFVDDFVVTLYTSNEKMHDFITQTPGSFKKKWVGLSNLSKLGAKIHIKTLLMQQTFKTFPDLIKFANSHFTNFHFNINSLHMVNNAWDNRAVIGVRFSEAKPYIEEALDYAEENNIIASAFVPMCVIDPYYWHYFPVGFGEIIKRSISITPNGKVGKAEMLLREFINKPAKCQRCILKNRCYWPWEGYVNYYGEGELSPIIKNEGGDI